MDMDSGEGDRGAERDGGGDEPLVLKSSGATSTGRGKKAAAIVTLDSDIFSDVDVRLSVILGHGTMAVRALLDMTEGSEIALDTPLDGSVEVTLNNRIVARGEIVAVGDRFGVRITQIVAQRQSTAERT
jgi:flagellar motor switch protein FliN/FliY